MFSHQNVDVLLREVYGALRCEIDELSVLGPVVLGVRVPIHGELLNFEHREALLLLDLVVYVQEGADVPVVSHRVGDTLSDESEVEGLVSSADASVFKTEMYISDIEA